MLNESVIRSVIDDVVETDEEREQPDQEDEQNLGGADNHRALAIRGRDYAALASRRQLRY